jgi:hypothetical protein
MSILIQFRKIFDRSPSTRRTTARRSSVRLAVESLEDRVVASASSASLHAVTESTGQTVAYFTNPIGKEFWEKSDTGSLVEIANSASVDQFSAGLAITGKAILFAQINPAEIFQYGGPMDYYTDATGWQNTNAPIGMTNFAAVSGGRLYAVGSNHALWEYTVPHQETRPVFNLNTHQEYWVTVTVGGWSQLTAANQVYSVDAVTQVSGVDGVFVEGYYGSSATNRLEVYSLGALTYLGGGGDVQLGYSAGLDVYGNAEVWYQLTQNDGVQNYGFSSWTAAAGVHTYLYLNKAPRTPTLSATGSGQCYFFQPDYYNPDTSLPGALKIYDPLTTDTLVVVALQSNAQISAAGAGNVFYISNGYLAEVTVNADGSNAQITSWNLPA